MNRKQTYIALLRHGATLWLGAAILAFGLFNVHSRSGVTEGGVLGMTLLLNHWFGITPGITGLSMDLICYFIAYKLLGSSFLKNAIFASLGFSLFYNLFEQVGYLLPDLSTIPLAAAVAGGVFVGVGVGIVVKEGGASGGDDALALILKKLTNCRISAAYFVTDFVVLMLSLSYIPFQRIVFSLITVTLSSAIIDLIQRIPTKKQVADPCEPTPQPQDACEEPEGELPVAACSAAHTDGDALEPEQTL